MAKKIKKLKIYSDDLSPRLVAEAFLLPFDARVFSESMEIELHASNFKKKEEKVSF